MIEQIYKPNSVQFRFVKLMLKKTKCPYHLSMFIVTDKL